MFKFLKDKLKGAIEKITKKIEEVPEKEVEVKIPISEQKEETKEAQEKEEIPKIEPKIEAEKQKPEKKKKPKKFRQEIEQISKSEEPVTKKKLTEAKIEDIGEKIKEKPEKHRFFNFLKKKKENVLEEPIKKETEKTGQVTEIIRPEEKKGFFQAIKEKVSTKIINEKQFDDLFWDLELTLLENNVSVEVIEKIKNDLKNDLTTKPIKRDKIEAEIKSSLKNSIENLFNVSPIDIIKKIKEKSEKPFVIVFFGINGSGKTTSISKLANILKKQNISSVISASDTFRAAAIQQLEEQGNRIGVKIIKHDYGSDPSAVAFDAIAYAKANNIDLVLIDTAGRLHSNVNLMGQMKKIVRVSNPDLKIFVGESITGNDVLEQARTFNDAIGIDGLILTKADVDEKGGAMISASYVISKPILYLGVGQGLDDLENFDKEKIMANLGL